ncbi:hypothetical protein ABZ917_34585 [Nonomuraea wenchangensis]
MEDITMAHNPKFIRRRLGTTVLVVVAVLVAAILLAGVIALLGTTTPLRLAPRA